MAAQAEGSGLFVVFFLSLYTIVLVPYTIYRLCNLSEDKHVVKPWAKVRRNACEAPPASTAGTCRCRYQLLDPWRGCDAQGSKKPAWFSGALQQLTKPGNLVLLGLWAFFAFLVFYVQVRTIMHSHWRHLLTRSTSAAARSHDGPGHT